MSSNVSYQPTFASFYDFYDDPEYRQEQLLMYRGLASEAGASILELACGTGIITIELARAGFHVTGLDISSDMLQIAQKKIACEDADVQSRIRLIKADMKDFDCFVPRNDEKFNGIFIPSNSFGYLLTLDEQKSCLQASHAHLKPQGLMVIEERNYTPEVLMGMLQRRAAIMVQMARVNPLTGKYTTYNSMTTHIDFITQTIYGRQFIDEIQDDGTVKRYVPADSGTRRMHYFNRFELQLLIEQAGFIVRNLWGSHDKQPLGPRSFNMIFVAQKNGG
jgi:ubiquinone/menaquinone biosynthesis C-methylase UbiE